MWMPTIEMWMPTVEMSISAAIISALIVVVALIALIRARAVGAVTNLYYLTGDILVRAPVILVTYVIYLFNIWWYNRKLPGMKIRLLNIKHLIFADVNYMQKEKTEEFSDSSNVYLLQLFSAYTQLYRNEMMFNFQASFVPILITVKAQIAEQILKDTKHIEKSWTYGWVMHWLQTGLLTSKGQKWKTRRRLITPSFHFDILKDFFPVINEQSQYLLTVLEKETEKDWTDVAHLLSLCTLDIICETTLGVKVNAQRNSNSQYVQSLNRASSIVMRRLSNPLYFLDQTFNHTKLGKQYLKDVEVLHEFTRAVIKRKKEEALNRRNVSTSKHRRKALMDILLEHHLADGSLTEEDIREEVDTFAFAGHDTTSIGISWTLYLIGLHKDVQARLQEELDGIFGDDFDERPVTVDDLRHMKYMECVIKESLRLYPPVPMIGRRATADTVIDGKKIPEGIVVLIYIYELHRDPEVFPNPERFDPDRFLKENSIGRHPYAYIPFSAGPRNCIGQKFAMMEEKVILSSILRNYTVESLDPRDRVLPAPEVVLRNSKPFRIKIRRRMR